MFFTVSQRKVTKKAEESSTHLVVKKLIDINLVDPIGVKKLQKPKGFSFDILWKSRRIDHKLKRVEKTQTIGFTYSVNEASVDSVIELLWHKLVSE